MGINVFERQRQLWPAWQRCRSAPASGLKKLRLTAVPHAAATEDERTYAVRRVMAECRGWQDGRAGSNFRKLLVTPMLSAAEITGDALAITLPVYLFTGDVELREPMRENIAVMGPTPIVMISLSITRAWDV